MNKQQLIVIVGHDNSGKSHIAKALSERINVPIFKMSVPKRFWDPIIAQRYSTEAILQVIEQTKLSTILDRGFPCDYMYSKLFNRDFDYGKLAEIDSRFAAMQTLIVLCYKDAEAFLDDEEDRIAFGITTEAYEKMTGFYREYLEMSKCKSIIINTSDENLEAQLDKIILNI